MVVHVHDGDTFHALVPLEHFWPDMQGVSADVRVAHCNAAELGTPNGNAAAVAVKAWLAMPEHSPLTLHVWGREKYGRLLADAEFADGSLLSTYVLGLAGTVPMLVRDQLSL